MKKRIAIIGSSDQQNPLIEKARAMGFETHVFAWQTGYDLGEKSADHFYPISTRDKEEILRQTADLGVAAVASIGSDMAAVSAAYVAEKLGLTTTPYENVLRATNKLHFRETLKAVGLSQPRHIAISGRIPEEIGELKYPLVVKPSDRSGARGVKLILDERPLMKAVSAARDLSFERKAIVEEFVDGQSFSAECISFGGKHAVVAYTRRRPRLIDDGPIDTAYTIPAILPESLKAGIGRDVCVLLDSLGIRYGASSVEFITAGGRAYFIEVTPSMYADYVGTDLVPAATSYDYLKAVVDVACGKAPEERPGEAGAEASVRFLYSEEEAESAREKIIYERTPGDRIGHCFSFREHVSFGGCPKWQFDEKTEYYTGDRVIGLNSEYTAVWYALKCIGAGRVHVPYYSSPALLRTVREAGAEPVCYRIGPDFRPVDLPEPGEGDAVLAVNYFGLCSDFIADYAGDRRNLIIDNSTCFYADPVLAEGIWNVYSCRKFFPVPDGGYLITADPRRLPLPKEVSYKRARALLRSFELGQRDAYKEYMTNEQELADSRAAMSSLTSTMLASIDYERAKAERAENYRILHAALRSFNLLKLPEDGAIPQLYPLLVERDIRNLLLKYNIFVPLMWRSLLNDDFTGTTERRFAEKMLYLPIEPSCSREDMAYLAEAVTAALS